jgi:hypothetical protein
MIVHKTPGPLSLRGNVFGDGAAAVTPKVSVDTMNIHGFVSHGNLWWGEDGITKSPYLLNIHVGQDPPFPVRISIEGDIFVDALSSPVASTFTDPIDTTPAVHTGHLFYAKYAKATTITNLTQGYVTQRVLIIALDGNTTIAHDATKIVLRDGKPRALKANESIELVYSEVAPVVAIQLPPGQPKLVWVEV